MPAVMFLHEDNATIPTAAYTSCIIIKVPRRRLAVAGLKQQDLPLLRQHGYADFHTYVETLGQLDAMVNGP